MLLRDTTYVEDYLHNPPDVIIFEEDTMHTVMDKFQSSGAWNLPV